MKNLQEIKSNQQSKYEEIIEYLSQDNGYWLENDKWDLTKDFFIGKVARGIRYIDFSKSSNEALKNELKFFILFSYKESLLKASQIARLRFVLAYICDFVKINSFNEINLEKDFNKWKLYLINKGIKHCKENYGEYFSILNVVTNFIKDFYDDREETEKDIWYSKNIQGLKIRATQSRKSTTLNFNDIPLYYREIVKRYFKHIIWKKSFDHCFNILVYLRYFFKFYYSSGYEDGFIENLTREDIEKYLSFLYQDKSSASTHEKHRYISQIRMFLEYIQMAQFEKSPQKEVNYLIFNNDMPKVEKFRDALNRTKFIPEPILKQLDNNIMDLDRPQFIPIYILLRETGWRGTDILNLRYDNCLEQIWNNKEEKYNYYLCGEITKTGIAQLKIPIRDKVAEMIQDSIDKAKDLSTNENNPKKYLFNTYEGKLKGAPLAKHSLLNTIKRLIVQKDIRDANGELYHFRLHSLRHTRAKEYVEQGMGISVIQQILGHRSLQMTVHYATVSENVLYEKWKNTEDLELFKVDTINNELIEVDTSSTEGENLIRYEYVKKNLDAVRVPFGVCFKASKLPCKQQMNHCLTCASFCTTVENIPEYEEEIEKVKQQIEISNRCGRELWAEKNKQYLNILEQTLEKVKEHKLVHKNGKSREDIV